jgi:hypothetical protein
VPTSVIATSRPTPGATVWAIIPRSPQRARRSAWGSSTGDQHAAAALGGVLPDGAQDALQLHRGRSLRALRLGRGAVERSLRGSGEQAPANTDTHEPAQ